MKYKINHQETTCEIANKSDPFIFPAHDANQFEYMNEYNDLSDTLMESKMLIQSPDAAKTNNEFVPKISKNRNGFL